mgnify:CR=1 FL=1
MAFAAASSPAARVTRAHVSARRAGAPSPPRLAGSLPRPRLARRDVIVPSAKSGTPEAASGSGSVSVSRRGLVAGKVAFTVCEAFVFPWATESATRPPSPATADLVPFSPAWLESVLYQRTAPDAKARAKAALLRGEALAAEGQHLDAIAAFESVYATAPTEYKMCQRAGLDIAKSYKSLSSKPGDAFDRRAEDAKGVVWWWGRGTRWPGWYIIAYLSARNAWFTAKDDDVGAFTANEGIFVLVPVWLGLLFCLVQFGVPDF